MKKFRVVFSAILSLSVIIGVFWYVSTPHCKRVIYDTNDYIVISADIGNKNALVQQKGGSKRLEGTPLVQLSPNQTVTLRYTYKVDSATNDDAYVSSHYQPLEIGIVPISPMAAR